jgi:small-conductance mechanosensitive channel
MLSPLRDLLREVLTSPLIQFGETTVTLLWMLQLLLAFFIVLIVSRTLKTFLKYHLLTRLQVDLSSREAVSTFVGYIIGFIGFFIVLQSTGFDFSSLILIAGSLGVGIGFGL